MTDCPRVKCDADEGCAAAVLLFLIVPLIIVAIYVGHIRLSEIRDRLPPPPAEKK